MIVVDKKTKFVLSLQGKQNAGHLDHWTVVGGEMAGLRDSHYQLVAREENYKIIDNEYVVVKHAYYTLGKECTHAEIIEIMVTGK